MKLGKPNFNVNIRKKWIINGLDLLNCGVFTKRQCWKHFRTRKLNCMELSYTGIGCTSWTFPSLIYIPKSKPFKDRVKFENEPFNNALYLITCLFEPPQTLS